VSDAKPGEIVRHELGDLGDGEDHHEVEEQLQRRDALFALDLTIGHRYEVVGRGTVHIDRIVCERRRRQSAAARWTLDSPKRNAGGGVESLEGE
jgi:hypothetical protein